MIARILDHLDEYFAIDVPGSVNSPAGDTLPDLVTCNTKLP